MTARLILSAGMLTALAVVMAVRRRAFDSGSPPVRAAIMISLIRRVKTLPRLASSAAFLCLIVAHLLCPDIEKPQDSVTFEDNRSGGDRRQESGVRVFIPFHPILLAAYLRARFFSCSLLALRCPGVFSRCR